MTWTIRGLRRTPDGVEVHGTFDGVERVVAFPVSRGSTGVVVVSRPPELEQSAVAPGSAEQSMLDLILMFYRLTDPE